MEKKKEKNSLELNDFNITTLTPDIIEGVSTQILKMLNVSPEDFVTKYEEYKKAEAAFNEIYEPFKKDLIQLHKDRSDFPNTIVVGDTVKLTYVSPSVRTTIDTKTLKEEEPELAEKFKKITNVSAQIRLENI